MSPCSCLVGVVYVECASAAPMSPRTRAEVLSTASWVPRSRTGAQIVDGVPTGSAERPSTAVRPADRAPAAACHNLPMQDVSHIAALVTGAAFLLAAVFGAVAARVNFCTMGAISDVVNFGDSRRLRMWVLAVAVAVAGAGALQAAGPGRPVEDAVHRQPDRLAFARARRIPVRVRDDARAPAAAARR